MARAGAPRMGRAAMARRWPRQCSSCFPASSPRESGAHLRRSKAASIKSWFPLSRKDGKESAAGRVARACLPPLRIARRCATIERVSCEGVIDDWAMSQRRTDLSETKWRRVCPGSQSATETTKMPLPASADKLIRAARAHAASFARLESCSVVSWPNQRGRKRKTAG